MLDEELRDDFVQHLAMCFRPRPHIDLAHRRLFFCEDQVHPLANLLREVDVLDVDFAHSRIDEASEQLVQQIRTLGKMREQRSDKGKGRYAGLVQDRERLAAMRARGARASSQRLTLSSVVVIVMPTST